MARPLSATTVSDGVIGLADDTANTVTSKVMGQMKGVGGKIAEAMLDGDFNAAKEMANELEFTDIINEVAPKPNLRLSRQLAILGTGAVDSPKNSLWANGAPFPWEVDTGAVRQFTNVAAHWLDRDVGKALEKRLNQTVPRLQKAAFSTNGLASQINKYLRGETYRVVNATNNIIGTRVAAFGMFHEARVRGITRYRLDATLDHRTTEICRNLHGKEFDVEPAYIRTQSLLGIEDPTNLAKTGQWPDPKAAAGLKNTDPSLLQAIGIDTPPFHYLCRTVVTLIESAVAADYEEVEYKLFERASPSIGRATEFFEEKFFSVTLPELYEARNKANPNKKQIDPKEEAQGLKELGTRPETAIEMLEDQARLEDFETPMLGVKTYTGGAYGPLNSALRFNEPLTGSQRRMLDGVDKQLAVSMLDEDIVVYRGVSGAVSERMQTGVVFQDDAVMSTSLVESVARNFAGESGTVVKMILKKGTPGIYAKQFSNYDNEMEVVLPRSSQMRIVNEVKDDRGRRVLHAVWVGQGDHITDPSQVGQIDKPELDSIVKVTDETVENRGPKYVWTEGDVQFIALTEVG